MSLITNSNLRVVFQCFKRALFERQDFQALRFQRWHLQGTEYFEGILQTNQLFLLKRQNIFR